MTKDELSEILKAHSAWLAGNGDCPNLYGVNLSEADLSRANLSSANLREADLSRADLSEANLYGADLSRADLSKANLSKANLYGADLYGANLSEANHVIALGQPNGWWAFAYLWERTIWLRVGCRTKSLPDGRAYWVDKEDRREVLAALDYAETIARLRGWEVKS
jgi:hypothetical protein